MTDEEEMEKISIVDRLENIRDELLEYLNYGDETWCYLKIIDRDKVEIGRCNIDVNPKRN